MQMKLSITGLVCLLAVFNLDAQINWQFDSLDAKITPSDYTLAHNRFTNTFIQQRTFRWTRKVLQITPGWETSICDANACYSPSVNSGEVTLGPNHYSRLDVRVYPHGNYDGYAFVEVKVEFVHDTTINSTAYFAFNSQTSTATQEWEPLNLKVYPNPSSGLFQLEYSERPLAKVKVFDSAGHLVKRLNLDQDQLIDLSQLASGTYILQFFDENDWGLDSKLITKW